MDPYTPGMNCQWVVKGGRRCRNKATHHLDVHGTSGDGYVCWAHMYRFERIRQAEGGMGHIHVELIDAYIVRMTEEALRGDKAAGMELPSFLRPLEKVLKDGPIF
jgi:hypothetical protein